MRSHERIEIAIPHQTLLELSLYEGADTSFQFLHEMLPKDNKKHGQWEASDRLQNIKDREPTYSYPRFTIY